MNGGGLYDPKDSTISIRGATLIVGGGLENRQGSTITFGIGNNGQMGKLQGNLTNQNGVVNVDTKGANLDTPYQIITGSTSGFSTPNFTNLNEFLSANYANGH